MYIYGTVIQQPATQLEYDVLIIGAGPAGCACALALKDAGLRVAMIDKATFPRDKVCGDAIPGRAVKTLEQIDPSFAAAFKEFPTKCATKKTTLFYKGKELTFTWVREAYTCTRMEFDNFLYELVSRQTKTTIYADTQPAEVKKTDDGFRVTVKNSDSVFACRILIGADGAQSALAKQLAGKVMDRAHHVGSVRAYYSGMQGMSSDTTEIYFDKRFLPSYLWVFPLPEGKVNVGFGMLSSEIAKRKINLKKVFHDFINHVPELSNKFENAVAQSPLEGFGLPLGSSIGSLSGDHYMLAGDAASLIDPMSGDGIGNAMASGRLAAVQAMECFEKNDFTATFIQAYDKAVKATLGAELKTHYRTQRIMSRMPFLLDVLFLATKSKKLKQIIQKAL